MSVVLINPNKLATPRGYSHGVLAAGRQLAIAGQIGWSSEGKLVSPEFVAQFDQALANFCAVLHEAGGVPDDVVLMRIYVTDKRAYLALRSEVGAVYRHHMGKHFPAMSLVQVSDLLEDGALVEIEGLAVLP